MTEKNNYIDFFKKLTGFYPYKYQEDSYSIYYKGKNNIIQAPTGSGKTWGAMAPFIFCWKEWKDGRQNREDYPRKLIYSLPLRTLANSLFNEVLNKIEEKFPELDIKIKLQTGEFPNDLFFEGDIIFTTIDQTLSNVLGIPLSLPKKLANINAGAVISSYLIFDEFHLLDPKASLKTTVILLDTLKKNSQFCLMTATLSKKFLDKSSQFLNAEITKVNKEDYNSFAFVKNNAQRNIRINKKTLTVEKIIKEHKQKTIVICNTVDRCVNIFKELLIKKENQEINSEIICIHSRFFQTDRKEKENKVLELFGNKSNADVILVSTQVIEVGLDISCDTMHTEISPINSLVQRAGRCSRWQGKGELFIYNVPERKYLPYKNELSESTFKTLNEYQNKNLDFYLSQEIIEKVLTEYETNIFNEIQKDSINVWRDIKNSWQTGNQSYVRPLIRDIRSISIVLLPKNYKTDSLYKFESISMNPYSLKRKIEVLLDTYEGEQPIIAMKLEESNFEEFNFEEFKELNQLDPSDIYLENIVALNSDEVGYNSEYGLDFYSVNKFQSKMKKRKIKYEYQIKKDTYEQHIQWMLKAYKKIDEIWFPFRKIQQIKFKQFNFDEILTYIIIMHDYGKLNTLWQEIVNNYQRLKAKQMNKIFQPTFLAHTDYDPTSDSDNELMKTVYKNYKINKKPSHAGIGAFVTLCVLPAILKLEKNNENHSLLKIIVTTINRHHAAHAKTFPNYKVSNKAVDFINEKLIKKYLPSYYVKEAENFPFYHYEGGDLEGQQIQFNDILETFLYFLFVRTLRLCDQHSFEENNYQRRQNE